MTETVRAAGMGFLAISLPSALERDRPNWNHDSWEPLWSAAEEAGMVLAVHVGSDAKSPDHPDNRPFRGPGGALMNYVESSYSGQRMATTLVASGVLDRHPKLRLLISEGGATWVPFIADRIEEGYRQHRLWVRPVLFAHLVKSCTSRYMPRFSTIGRQYGRARRSGTETSCSGATIRISRARSAIPKRRCMSSSTTSTRAPPIA